MDLQKELAQIFKGDLQTDEQTLDFYSHDASIFELRPQIVASPKDVEDLKNVVRFVGQNKTAYPDLSITPRSRGTDMSGGAIGQSIVLDISKYMNEVREVTAESAHVQPGKLYREFDAETLKFGSILPSFPASREFVKESAGMDIRVFVVGGKVVASMKRQSLDDDFRSNLHQGGAGEKIKLTDEERKVAIKAARSMGLNMCGVDLMRSERGPLVLEVNSSPGFGIEVVTGRDVATPIIEYIERNAKRRPKKDKVGA